MQHLALDAQRRLHLGQQRAHPCTGADDELACAVVAAVGLDVDVRAVGLPAHHRFVEVQAGATTLRLLELRATQASGESTPARGSHTPTICGSGFSTGKRVRSSSADSMHVLQAVQLRAAQCAGHERAVWRANHQAAGGTQQRAARKALQLAPAIESALHHRHVDRMLEVSLADDARLAMRRAQGVRWREAIEADHVDAAARQLAVRPRCPSRPSRRSPRRAGARHSWRGAVETGAQTGVWRAERGANRHEHPKRGTHRQAQPM